MTTQENPSRSRNLLADRLCVEGETRATVGGFSYWGGWIRTTITGSKGRGPAVERRPIVLFISRSTETNRATNPSRSLVNQSTTTTYESASDDPKSRNVTGNTGATKTTRKAFTPKNVKNCGIYCDEISFPTVPLTPGTEGRLLLVLCSTDVYEGGARGL